MVVDVGFTLEGGSECVDELSVVEERGEPVVDDWSADDGTEDEGSAEADDSLGEEASNVEVLTVADETVAASSVVENRSADEETEGKSSVDVVSLVSVEGSAGPVEEERSKREETEDEDTGASDAIVVLVNEAEVRVERGLHLETTSVVCRSRRPKFLSFMLSASAVMTAGAIFDVLRQVTAAEGECS